MSAHLARALAQQHERKLYMGLRPLVHGIRGSLCVLMLLVAGCAVLGPSVVPHSRPTAQIFREALPTSGFPTHLTLDPNVAFDANSYTALNLLFDGLVTLNGDMTVRLWGARGIDVSPDGLTYTFYLRSGQFFSDGTPVRPSDYAYSMNRALNPCLASQVAYQHMYAIVDAYTFANENCLGGGITAKPGQTGPVIKTLIGDSILPDDGDGTLTVRLQQPSGYFLAALAHPEADALEASVVGSDIASVKWTSTLSPGATGRGGSGMYYVRSWDQQAGHLVLARNPHWWGVSAGMAPRLSEIELTVFRDADAAYAAYQAGKVDVAIPAIQDLPRVMRLPDYHETPELALYFLALNWAVAPFDNADARLAFCLAINRDAVNQDVYGGAWLPTWHLVPRGMPGYAPGLTGPDGVTSTGGDAARALAHWQAYLGTLHGKAPPPITFTYLPESTSEHELAGALQKQWLARINVMVSIVPLDLPFISGPAAYYIHQATVFEWYDDYPDPQDFLSLLVETGVQYNAARASVPAADALLQRADVALNPVERMALYNQAEQVLINQAALCPLLQGVVRYQLHTWVRGWSLDPEGIPANDAWLATSIAAH